MNKAAALVTSLLVALLVSGCTSESSQDLSTTPTADQTVAPTVPKTASPTPKPTPRQPFVLATPTPDPDLVTLAATVWLVDLRDGAVTTIIEDYENWPYSANFTGDGDVLVRYWLEGGRTDYTFARDGALLGEAEPERRCGNTDDGAKIDNQLYPGVVCGSIPPDGNLMTYGLPTRDVDVNGRSTESWDQWLVDLATGETRLLQAGFLHCGGCDFKFGPIWSPSGRYLVVPDLVYQVFLIDLDAGTSIDIAVDERATHLSSEPTWAPMADRLLRPGLDGSTILEDFDAGTSVTLPELPWPAAFDPAGSYIYSPAWAVSTESGPHQLTTIADATTGAVVGTRAGTPSWEQIWEVGASPLVAIDGGFVAALENSDSCDGTLISEPGLPAAACIEGAVAAVFSPDSSLVALAREVGRTGPIAGPRLDSYNGLPLFEIVVFDRATAEVTVVADGAVSYQFPALSWSKDGTLLLIRWPNVFGL